MAFVVEDGTGLEDANSFCSVEFADSYFSDRGVTAWTGSASAKETALVRATDYISNRFTFRRDPYSEEQALPFPWEDYDTGLQATIPTNLLKATAEYALRALSAALAPDPDVDDTGVQVVEKTEKVGPLEETTKYQVGGQQRPFRPYPAADMLLRGLVVSGGRVIRG